MKDDYDPGDKNAYLQTCKWRVTRAPAPSDVLWENLNSDPNSNKKVHLLMTVGFFFIFLFVMTPTSFLVYTEKSLIGLHLNFLLTGLVSAWLPTVCTLIYQSLVLPYCVKTMVSQERHHSKSAQFNSALQKYFLYNLFYILILQLFSLQAVSFLGAVLHYSADDVLGLMANSIAYDGTLFCTFIIHSALLAGGFTLLSPGKLISVFIKKSRAVSASEQEKAYAINKFPLAEFYAKNLTVLAITQVYSVAFPLVLVAALMYFFLHVTPKQYWIDKHNLLVLRYVQPVGSRAVTKRVLKFMVFYVFLFQLLTGGVIILGGNQTYYGVGAALIAVGGVVMVILLCIERRIVRRLKRLVVEEADEQMSMLMERQAYKHPCEPAGS
jgi:hypothetical protein